MDTHFTTPNSEPVDEVPPECTVDPVAAPKTRNRWRFDNGEAVVYRPDKTQSSFSIIALPDASLSRLAYEGLVARLSKSDDMQAEYNSIMSTEFSAPKATKPKPVNHWRTAIAMARVDAKKKSPEPTTLDEAKAWAVALDADKVRIYKTDPTVAKHFRKLAGLEEPSLAD